MFIDIIGTSNFWDNWNTEDNTDRGSATEKMETIRDFVESCWSDDVATSSDFEVVISYWDEQIPEVALNYEEDLSERRAKANSYLKNTWESYDTTTAGLIVDHARGGALGYGTPGGVGPNPGEKFAIVDTFYEDDGNFDAGYHYHTKSEGTAAHEVAHQFEAIHRDGSLFHTDKASLLADENAGAECLSDGSSWNYRTDEFSNCNVGNIHTHIEDYNLNG